MSSNLIFKIKKPLVDGIVSKLIDSNKAFFDKTSNATILAQIQAAAILSQTGEFDEFCDMNGSIRFANSIPVRVFPSEDDVYYIKYSKSFIHIPKTAGRHMIYNYFVFQTGGNHMFANEDSVHYNEY